MYYRSLNFFFISTFLYVSCEQQCDIGSNPEKAFADDYANNLEKIQTLSDSLYMEQYIYLCETTLDAAGKIDDKYDRECISIDDFNFDNYTAVKTQYAPDKKAVNTFPIQCSIARRQDDTRAFYCLASTDEKIYFVQMKGNDFVYQKTVCLDKAKFEELGAGVNETSATSQDSNS